MQHQALKQEALESLKYLPDDADIDEIMYRLYVIERYARVGQRLSRVKLLRIVI